MLSQRMRKNKPLPPAQPQHELFNELARVPISLHLGSYRSDLLYWGYFPAKWWRNYLHTHSFFEVCCAYAGRGTYTLRGEEHPLREGDLFLARPGEQHEIVSSRKQALGIYFWACTFVRDTQHPTSDRDKPIDILLQRMTTSRCFIAPHAASIQPTLDLLIGEMAKQAPGFTRAIESLAAKLLLDCARTFIDSAVDPEPLTRAGTSAAQAVVQTATQYLQDNLARSISVRDVAAQVHLSERQLSRVFRKVTGMSILEYLTRLRIDTAGQLLLSRDMPIKQVARAVGYPDAHYFTTTFGKHTGLTPAAFRRAGGTRFAE
jgi:AraC-like DNA-binding protein